MVFAQRHMCNPQYAEGLEIWEKGNHKTYLRFVVFFFNQESVKGNLHLGFLILKVDLFGLKICILLSSLFPLHLLFHYQDYEQQNT